MPRRVTPVSPVLKSLLALGVQLGANSLMTIRGRKSGQRRTTPVAIAEASGRRWLARSGRDALLGGPSVLSNDRFVEVQLREALLLGAVTLLAVGAGSWSWRAVPVITRLAAMR